MLWCVVHSEPPFSILLLQKFGEVYTSVLPAMVRPKVLNLDSMLCVHPHCKSFVGVKSLVLSTQDLEVGVAGVVISEGNIVLSPTNACDWRWSPQISMHFSTKTGGYVPLTLPADNLPY